MTKEELDIWLEGCLIYYYKQTGVYLNMKSTEERISQLELAHSRLFNQQKEIIADINNLNEKITKELELVLSKLKELSSTEEIGVLPDKMITGKKYIARISEIIGSSTIHWKSRNKDYTNWQVKLFGKDPVYIAFINSLIILEPDMLVEFTFENPYNLKHLKLYE